MARHRPVPGRHASPPHARRLWPLVKILVLLLCVLVFPAAAIGLGLDAVLSPHRCGGAPMAAQDQCMHAGTKLSRYSRYREELLPAAEVTELTAAARRRHHIDTEWARVDPDAPPAPDAPDDSALRARLAEFGEGRTVGLRGRDAQIRRNRIYGAVVLSGGAMFLIGGPLLLPGLVDDLRERRAWRAHGRRSRRGRRHRGGP